MRAAIGLLAVAGAAAGFLLCTGRGQQFTRQANEKLQDGYDELNQRFRNRKLDGTIQQALGQPHPDTAMARAFEEAVA